MQVTQVLLEREQESKPRYIEVWNSSIFVYSSLKSHGKLWIWCPIWSRKKLEGENDAHPLSRNSLANTAESEVQYRIDQLQNPLCGNALNPV